jgi:uncharacterized protein involved in exopolysaccharide biosynthesis
MIGVDSDGGGPHDEGIDLIVIWKVLRQYKIFIAICTLVCTAAAAVFALVATPMYRAEATIAEAHDSNMGGAANIAGQLGGLASLAGVNLGANSGNSRDAHAILKSRRLAEQFLERYNLTEKVLAKSRVPQTLWHAVARFRKSILDVDEDRRTGVTTISIYWRDAKEAAQWANDYVALGNEIIRNRAAADAQRNVGYLNQQLQQTGSVEVQHALSNLIESETKTLMLAKGRAEYAFSTIDPAVPPEVKASPKIAIVVLVGAVVGIFAGLLAAMARYKIAGYRIRAAWGTRSTPRV